MVGPTPTPEQAEAMATYGDGIDCVLQAGAGCGKSSTLKMIARSDSRRRMTYIAYNKAIATDAARSFPGNVLCSTGHGLAYDARYKPRLNSPRQTAHAAGQALNVKGILGILGSPPAIKNDAGALTAMTTKIITRVALDTVSRWCHSADAELSGRHVPGYDGLREPGPRAELLALVLPVAHAIWQDLLGETGVIKLTHDHYLKMWALSGPRLPSDVVLLDEAQDTNDVLTAVLLAQDHAQRIAVGDSAQAIYGWRGANDALQKFVKALSAPELTLSQSFRFGPAIATEANRWLHIIGAPLRLTGWDQCESMVGTLRDPDAILCRTNAGAMSIVIEALDAGRKVALVGGGSDIQRLAWAAQALQQGQPTDHPELLAFPSWQAVREYAEEEDGSLKVLVKLIDDHGTKAILAAADRLASEDQAELVVSTAHRSKGREWDRVRVHDDFLPPKPDPKNQNVILRKEEGRLAYVTVTRARRVLDNVALDWVHTVTAVSD